MDHDRIDISPQEIHLWLVDYADIEQAALPRLIAMLSDEERQQQQRFFFARDRLRYLVTRAMVRSTLSRYLPIAPETWCFRTNTYGRPHIANAEAADSQLQFNVSHTHSLIVLAFSWGRALGVDVENILDRQVSIDLARRFFAPREVEALANTPLVEMQDRFFEYWTFKESYIKARSMGLSIPLDKFSFGYPAGGAVQIHIDPDLHDEPSRWQFWQLRPSSKYLLAVCAESLTASTTLIARRISSRTTEEPIDLHPSRIG